MEIIFSDAAEKQLRRFKKVSAWDIEEFVQEKLDDEKFQDYLEETKPDIVENAFYDSEHKVMIHAEINSERTTLEIQDIRRA